MPWPSTVRARSSYPSTARWRLSAPRVYRRGLREPAPLSARGVDVQGEHAQIGRATSQAVVWGAAAVEGATFDRTSHRRRSCRRRYYTRICRSRCRTVAGGAARTRPGSVDSALLAEHRPLFFSTGVVEKLSATTREEATETAIRTPGAPED